MSTQISAQASPKPTKTDLDQDLEQPGQPMWHIELVYDPSSIKPEIV